MNLIAALPASLSAFGMTRGEGSIRACIIKAASRLNAETKDEGEEREKRAAPYHLFKTN
jgi:hypothetical protein